MRRLLLPVAVALVLVAPACGSDGGDDTLTVFAAASLTDAFGEIADAFEAENPGVEVVTSFAGSSSLREQILAGAPADVFASANQPNMDELAASGEVESAGVFATNGLQIVVPAGNPASVDQLDDFADDDLLLGLCAPEVPCGDFARQALLRAGVDPAVDTEEPDVRALLTKVESGDLDAGIVYRTDVLSAGDGVEGVDLPAAVDVVAEYPIGTVERAERSALAADFVEFVLSPRGREILAEFGFGLP